MNHGKPRRRTSTTRNARPHVLLSHAQRALMPYIADLDAMLRERTEREARLASLGHLLLPGDHVLAPGVIGEILDACATVLTEAERVVFGESVDRDREVACVSELTVATLTEIIHRAEASLSASGATITNLPGRDRKAA